MFHLPELIDCFARNDRFFWMPIFGEEKRKKKAMPVNAL